MLLLRFTWEVAQHNFHDSGQFWSSNLSISIASVGQQTRNGTKLSGLFTPRRSASGLCVPRCSTQRPLAEKNHVFVPCSFVGRTPDSRRWGKTAAKKTSWTQNGFFSAREKDKNLTFQTFVCRELASKKKKKKKKISRGRVLKLLRAFITLWRVICKGFRLVANS